MSGQRGLTLLEVLIASAILALLAAASVPLLHEALGDLAEPVPQLELGDLSVLADRFMKAPSEFGFADITEVLARSQVSIAWPPHPRHEFANDAGAPPGNAEADYEEPLLEHAGLEVTIRCIRPDDSGIDHAWIVFECDGQCVSRWVSLSNPRKEST